MHFEGINYFIPAKISDTLPLQELKLLLGHTNLTFALYLMRIILSTKRTNKKIVQVEPFYGIKQGSSTFLSVSRFPPQIQKGDLNIIISQFF